MPITRISIGDFNCSYNGIKKYLSGGSANTDPLLSLGGVRSSEVLDEAELFDEIDADGVLEGYIDYRCIYVYNGSPVTIQDVQVIVTGALLSAAKDPAGVNGVATTIGSPTTAPVLGSEVFALSVLLGDLAPTQFAALWLKRNVPIEGNYINATSDLKLTWKLG